MKKPFAKRLSQYSSFALATIGISEASGQVIYTDIDPDFSGTLNSTFVVDLDNNGIVDIGFSNSFYAGSFYLYALVPSGGTNAFLGNQGTYYNYPFALDMGENISSGANGSFIGGSSNILNYNGIDGDWIDVADKFLGVRFDIDGQTHYGWVRLDVHTNSEYVVKDYAYESAPGAGIQAREGLSVEEQSIEGFSFYPNPIQDKLMLNATDNIEQIKVYDLLGKEVLSKKPNERDFQMEVSHLKTGVYLMEVSINGNTKAFKLIKK